MHATLYVCAHRHSNWHAHLWAICQAATTTTTKGKRLVTFTGTDFCSSSNSTGHFVIIIIIWHTQWVSGVCQLPSGKACQQGRHNCNSKTVDTFIALPCCDSFLSLSLSLSLTDCVTFSSDSSIVCAAHFQLSMLLTLLRVWVRCTFSAPTHHSLLSALLFPVDHRRQLGP